MMKVKVSSKVVELLDIVNDMNYDEIEHKVYKFMDILRRKHILSAFFEQNNLTIQNVIDCFENGYEEEYKFQVGDVVKNRDVLFIVTEEDLFEDTIFQHNKKHYTLICKAEDRKDLKQC